MPLVNTAVPNLIQGVSQQADATRFAGQCEEQENALSSVAEGLKKRPNTRHIGKLLTTAIDDNSFVHFINRSDSEKYVVITYKEHDSNNVHTHCKIRAFNLLDGTEASITVGGVEYNASFLNIINPATGANYTQAEITADATKSDTSYTVNNSNTPYLHSDNPRNDLKALSIGDTTLILNKSVGVGLKKNGDALALTPALEKKALVFIKQGDYQKKYSVTITGGIVGGAGSSITLSFTRYTYSSSGIRPSIRYYRWRVTGVTVNNGGANHSGNLSLSLSSNSFIYTQPVINFNVVGGVIQSSGHSIVNGGDFGGYGTNYSTYYNRNTGYGTGAPTVNATIVDGNPASGSAPVTATITSEGSSSAANADTDTILNRLVSTQDFSTDLNDTFSNGYYIKKNNKTNLVELLKKDQTEDFNISVSDGLGGSGLGVVYKEVGSITDLPTIAPDGYVVKVIGDTELSQDDFYVKFETKNGQTTTSNNITSTVGEGSWIETVAPEVKEGIDNSTMPYSLINNAVNNFVLEETNFEDRLAGDDLSNPLPSFVGSEIEAMFFFKNRLGFLSKENVIMSEAGFGTVNDNGKTVFNFGRTSVTTLLDSAPIDISVASSRVTNLKSAKGFQENLILFSENGQFVLKGGDVLTPKTVSIAPITNFNFEDQVDPLPLGSYIYFPFTRGAFTGLREFTVNASTDNYDSTEVTEHVPSYIPSNIIDMAGTTSEDMIVLLSGDEKGSLYIYNYFWNNNQKVLSAWSKFTFTGEIRGIEFIESSLYVVITNNGETNLVEMPLESGLTDTAGFVTHLDMRVATKVDKTPLASALTSAWVDLSPTGFENSFTSSNGGNLSVSDGANGSGYGTIASIAISNTNAKISGTFNCTSLDPLTTGNQLKIKGVIGSSVTGYFEITEFTHEITLGQNSFSYTPVPNSTVIINKIEILRTADLAHIAAGGDHTITLEDINIVVDEDNDTITLPYTPSDNSVEVYTTDGLKLNCTNSGATVTLAQAVTIDTDVFVGIPYTMKYTFSEQIFKAPSGQGKSPSPATKLMIRNGAINFSDTAFFKVKVTPKFRDTFENVFTPTLVGSSTLGALDLDSGSYRFPIFTKAEDTIITIENSSALPSNFQSAEFESFVHSRSNRIA
tara:strand:- start:6336 stop:9728 length:3393 start_codon:yes stop_codon:yes gene_type:complete